MSTLLSAQAIGFDNAFGPLFNDLHFTLHKGDKIGLLGDNGTGKSTLLKILSGELDSARGSVTLANHCLLARIEQHLSPHLQQVTLLEGVLERLPPAQRVSEGWRAEALLQSLGFLAPQLMQTADTLSGGQHMRLMLARALICQPDLLLLDEPGNHLDLPTLLWLEQFLSGWNGSFVMVSHDTTLLDNVTDCSWILRDGGLHAFRQPCSAARAALAAQDEAAALRFQAEQKEIDRVVKSAKRLAVWGRAYDNEGLSRKAQQMEKRAAWLKASQTTLGDIHPWRLQLQGEALEADRVLVLPAMTVRPHDDAPALFTTPEMQVKSGERIAIVGQNGGGKSSLLRQLWRAFQQQHPMFHPRARTGYYDQSLHQLNDEHTLNEALAQFAPLSEEQRKMALIGAGFPWSRHSQRIASLSGGERSRLLFVGLTLARYSLLLLDEPTNHLDITGKEELAEALNTFAGAVLLVSHDRQLVASTCTRFWLIEGEKLSEEYDFTEVSARLRAEQTVSYRDTAVSIAPESNTEDEEAGLIALLNLESKLEQDLARKPKHQKPALQTQWRAEIQRLKKQLAL
ncbi:ABC-F family ATP-binding cassette domain-containing protein [Pantoea eucrina]|uniref:ATP-binding cassette domain-containing protein n=1 Tax=Pantoea eucrina TaxID=472693 RepID=A0ABU5LJV1_9GAMM|nr:ABC-F family ATP-binding cassette domain-containing protein [Pantoea eucrina]MDZ7280217.1 ATP-binding cassette domain-containing protein [Pantoea eucrina]